MHDAVEAARPGAGRTPTAPRSVHVVGRGSRRRSTVTYLLPVVAIVLGVLVLGESVTITALAGIALVLAGVALTRHHAQVANPAEP
ncbi:MAG: DMT family transporter [Streptosporangiaceae bacterium]